MRIGVSAFAADNGRSGIGQYILNVLSRLPECNDDTHFVVFAPRRERALHERDHPRVTHVHAGDFAANPLVNILWHLLVFPVLLRRYRIDCAYMPAGNRRLSLFYGVPSVGTVHDLSQLHVKRKYDRFRMAYAKRILPFLMRRLDRIVSVSQSTARDLVDYAGIDTDRIRVVHNGADLNRFGRRDRKSAADRVASELSVSTPFILYTARLEHPGKNHVRLIEAFARLKHQRAIDHRLVLAGSRWNGSDAIDEAIYRTGMQDEIVLPGFVSDSLLPDLYTAADLFVFPSLFEGFGIPLVEAMRCGTPICAASISSIPEVVGDAAVLFDPYDVEGMARALERTLNDSALRETLTSKGIARADRFTWERTANDVLAVCEEALRS